MRTRWLFRQLGAGLAALICLWAVAGIALAQPMGAGDRDDPRSSFTELDRYGHWIRHPEWGSVWVPDVDDDWRPYTVGRWVNTEEHGWYWDSHEPFGWAVYHYGRWLNDADEGWIWIPGTEWGPAWVAWRYGEDAVGWAPLPPNAIWEPERGVIIEDDFYHASRYAPFWIFVAPRYLLAHGLHRHCWPTSRNSAYFHRTHPATHYHWENRRVFNRGIRVAEVERLTQSRVASVRIMSAARPTFSTRSDTSSVVHAYRPAIVPSDRWRSGSRGDWRKFEASPTPAARQVREFDAGRRPDDVRGDNRDRPAGSVPRVTPPSAGFAPPAGNTLRRDGGDRDTTRDGRGSRESFSGRDDRDHARDRAPVAPRSSIAPVPAIPRAEPPRRSFEHDRPREGRSFRDGTGPSSDRGPPARAFAQPPPPRPQAAPPQQARQQAAPPAPRPAPPPARAHKPAPNQPEATPGQGGGRRG